RAFSAPRSVRPAALPHRCWQTCPDRSERVCAPWTTGSAGHALGRPELAGTGHIRPDRGGQRPDATESVVQLTADLSRCASDSTSRTARTHAGRPTAERTSLLRNAATDCDPAHIESAGPADLVHRAPIPLDDRPRRPT